MEIWVLYSLVFDFSWIADKEAMQKISKSQIDEVNC